MKKFLSIFMGLAMTMAFGATALATGTETITSTVGNKVSIGKVDALDTVVSGVLGVVQVVGYAFALGMLLYVGIKYTMASANEKADLKKGSISYVIGAVIIFGASTLCGIFKGLAGDVVK